jgi:hypothetical protein
MLVGLPLVGLLNAGYTVSGYLEFPPKTIYVEHAPFSLAVFFGLGLPILLILLPFIYRTCRFISLKSYSAFNGEARFFPWWGYAGLLAGGLSWLLAWTRFSWFDCFQLHTFVPLWISYILVMSALTQRRKGSCLMKREPFIFISLFLVSMAFWWFFEYLNRFVQNWYYVEVSRFSPLEYAIFASASFSTVLPAVFCTREFLLTFSSFDKVFGSCIRIKPKYPKLLASVSLIVSSIGLACIGLLPNYLFPLLWVSPLIVIVSLQTLMNEKHILSDISQSRWTVIVVSAVSALICGFFWEMWNYFSMAKWIYSIPYVQAFHVFEMPLLGYAGYLPFGLECAVIGDMLCKLDPQAGDGG